MSDVHKRISLRLKHPKKIVSLELLKKNHLKKIHREENFLKIFLLKNNSLKQSHLTGHYSKFYTEGIWFEKLN